MLGRLPWFAFERRSRALRFLVFFDIRPQAYDRLDASPTAAGQNETAMVTTTVSHIYAMPAVFASNLRLADPVESSSSTTPLRRSAPYRRPSNAAVVHIAASRRRQQRAWRSSGPSPSEHTTDRVGPRC